MPRLKGSADAPPKVKVSFTMDPDLHEWIMGRVGPGKQFANLSHALERAVYLMREREEE